MISLTKAGALEAPLSDTGRAARVSEEEEEEEDNKVEGCWEDARDHEERLVGIDCIACCVTTLLPRAFMTSRSGESDTIL